MRVSNSDNVNITENVLKQPGKVGGFSGRSVSPTTSKSLPSYMRPTKASLAMATKVWMPEKSTVVRVRSSSVSSTASAPAVLQSVGSRLFQATASSKAKMREKAPIKRVVSPKPQAVVVPSASKAAPQAMKPEVKKVKEAKPAVVASVVVHPKEKLVVHGAEEAFDFQAQLDALFQ